MVAIILMTIGFSILIFGIVFGCSFLGIKKNPVFVLLGVSLAMLLYVIVLALMTYHRIITI